MIYILVQNFLVSDQDKLRTGTTVVRGFELFKSSGYNLFYLYPPAV